MEVKETILLVEDELLLQRVVAKGLRSLGYQVLVASSTKEAMQLWRDHQHNIDLLFSDIVMPEGITGLELAGLMKKEKPNLKIVLSSGYVPNASLQHEQIINVNLPKPYAMDKLSNVIRECLGSP